MRISVLVAHDCGYPLSRYTCRATRVAADFLDFIAFCSCSTGVALHPLKILVSHQKFWCRTSPPPVPGGVAPKFGSEKVSRYTGVSQLQLRVSRCTVQLGFQCEIHVSSANVSAKSHFQMSPFKMSPFWGLLRLVWSICCLKCISQEPLATADSVIHIFAENCVLPSVPNEIPPPPLSRDTPPCFRNMAYPCRGAIAEKLASEASSAL